MSPTFNLTCGVDGRTEKKMVVAIILFLWLVCRRASLPLLPHRRHAADSRAFSAPPATPAACDRFLMGDYCLAVGSAFLSTAFLRVFLAP